MTGEAFHRRTGILAVVMTGRAVDTDVGAHAREVSQIVVEIHGCPRVLRVTDRAVMVIIIGDVVGILNTDIIRLMALEADGWNIQIVAAGVTFDALRGNMRSQQRELGLSMIKGRGFPRTRGVAFSALMRELILHMAGIVRRLIIRLVA